MPFHIPHAIAASHHMGMPHPSIQYPGYDVDDSTAGSGNTFICDNIHRSPLIIARILVRLTYEKAGHGHKTRKRFIGFFTQQQRTPVEQRF
ncbi:hypothetical protein [Agrobacterium tumefaciens]|uniref:hypothetical protein n=1 Tax=Agrobacterium tumefaciens TaxID=358 RepID=UPI00287C8B96|nr:hypothetical protein [Agrobacterium tumefaciens]MDS7598087.1 hypothetical protein [Agrobacterium tumefaciens]